MKGNLFDLQDRVIVLTGATGVLGSSIAVYFAEQGAKVALIVREASLKKGEDIVSQIKAVNGEGACFAADVMETASLENACSQILFTEDPSVTFSREEQP